MSSCHLMVSMVRVTDGLLASDQAELGERVSHLERRVRESENEIVCLKGALADVMRRLSHVETSKSGEILHSSYG